MPTAYDCIHYFEQQNKPVRTEVRKGKYVRNKTTKQRAILMLVHTIRFSDPTITQIQRS